MGSLGDLLEQHQLPDVTIGGDPTRQVGLERRETPLKQFRY